MKKNSILALILAFASTSQAWQTFQTSNTVDGTVVPSAQSFTMGGRVQRVRFFLSNKKNITSAYTQESPQFQTMLRDPLRSAYSNLFANSISSPVSANLGRFGEDSEALGLIVNPFLVVCASDLLKMVQTAGNTNKEVIDKWAIDEINIFLKPVRNIVESDYKLEISPVAARPLDPALNVQIPVSVGIGTCALPKQESLNSALIKAAQMGNPNNGSKAAEERR